MDELVDEIEGQDEHDEEEPLESDTKGLREGGEWRGVELWAQPLDGLAEDARVERAAHLDRPTEHQ